MSLREFFDINMLGIIPKAFLETRNLFWGPPCIGIKIFL